MAGRRRVLILLNPRAGSAGKRSVIADIRTCGLAFGFDGEVRELGRREDPKPWLSGRLGEFSAVIAVGGDGTVSSAAAALAGTDVPLGIIPAGTENLFGRHLGYSSNPALLFEALHRGSVGSLDLIRCGNGHLVAVVLGVGFDAEVVHRLALRRSGHITHLSYFTPLWETFCNHRWPRIQVEVDGALLFQGRGFVLIGNLPLYSLGMRILPLAKGWDGRLDVCAFACDRRRVFLEHALRVLQGRHLSREGVFYAQGAQAIVSSPDRVRVQMDGEVAGHLPLQCAVLPRAVRIILPRGTHGED